MADADLIKTVRGLEKSGPGENGEHLESLWKAITSNSAKDFHAAEESTLRWLLKSMNGTSATAETLRRYPLTWAILELVFQRIPPFSLAKSLADRRFVAVLQQTLHDASKPVVQNGTSHTSTKRKRFSPSFDIGDLRSTNGCLLTAKAVFASILSLVNRIEENNFLSTHDKIGVEHIMSLFCLSSADAIAIMSPAFALCKLQVTEPAGNELDGEEEWIAVLSKIWKLHLQSVEDVPDISTHLFHHVSTILLRLGLTTGDKSEDIREPLKSKWAQDIQTFMHQNFVSPIRSGFASRKDIGPITLVLEVTKGMIEVSAPALYYLISGTAIFKESRKMTNEWAQMIFQAIEKALRPSQNRESIMEIILGRSIDTSMPVDVDTLRKVCHTYALRESSTNWTLLARCALCDPGIFQTSLQGKDLLLEVCHQLRRAPTSTKDEKAVKKVTGAVMESFRLARDLPGFMKLWIQQLSSQDSPENDLSVWWVLLGEQETTEGSLSSLIEAEMSPRQVKDLVDWVQSQPDLSPRAVSVFASTVAGGISSEPFVDVTGRTLFDLIKGLMGSKEGDIPVAGCRWRVINRTISWASRSDRGQIWDETKDELSKVLRKSPTLSLKTFEAFKYACQAWVVMASDDSQMSEPANMVHKFTERISSELGEMPSTASLFQRSQQSISDQCKQSVDYGDYLQLYTHGFSRLSRLYSLSNDVLPVILQKALMTRDTASGDFRSVWLSVINNEVNINCGKLANDLLDRMISAIDHEVGGQWPGEHAVVAMELLNRMPHDIMSRIDRERILAAIMKRKPSICTAQGFSDENWRTLLSLLTKMMCRPAFNDCFNIQTLHDFADALSRTYVRSGLDAPRLLEAVERYVGMAEAAVNQMAAQNNERSIKYFTDALDVLPKPQADIAAFHISLLQVLASELPKSAVFRSSTAVAHVNSAVVKQLGKVISWALHELASAKDPFGASTAPEVQKLIATLEAALALDGVSEIIHIKSKHIRTLEGICHKACKGGDLRAWKLRTLLYSVFSSTLEEPRPVTFDDLSSLPPTRRSSMLKSTVMAVLKGMTAEDKMAYAQVLVQQYIDGWETDGQMLAIQHVLDDTAQTPGTDLSAHFASIYSALITRLASTRSSRDFDQLSLILYSLLEKWPQSMTQWNIEATLFTVCTTVVSLEVNVSSFRRLCKLVEVIIKKHRLRIEGHYHVLVTTLQSLLKSLVSQNDTDEKREAADAQSFARLVTLICEPAAGAVARSSRHNSLDSATDAAKRSAGRHMYLLLMFYVKVQLEMSVPRGVRSVLEPAMDSIFDITPPEIRKILNDAMDANGRAILREMFKRYTKFGKWTGV